MIINTFEVLLLKNNYAIYMKRKVIWEPTITLIPLKLFSCSIVVLKKKIYFIFLGRKLQLSDNEFELDLQVLRLI